MKKTIITSAISLLLFAVSLFIATLHIHSKVVEQADETARKFNERASKTLDAILLGAQRVSYSMLAGYFFYMDSLNENSSSHEALNHSRFQISDVDYQILTEEDIYKTLEDFVRVNTNCHSAVFFMEPDAFPSQTFKYRAPMAYRDVGQVEYNSFIGYENYEIKRQDLRNSVIFEGNEYYKNVLDPNYKTLWRKTSMSNESNGVLITYYVPIYRKNGKPLGVFCMSFPLLGYANMTIKNGLPYKGSYLSIYNENGELLLSTTGEKEDLDDYLQYEATVKSTNWKIITYIPKDEAFAATGYIQKVLLFMSVLAIVFVSIAATSISRFLRKSLKQKEALASELKLASKTQMDILNPANCNTGKFKLDATLIPAKDVGGDLYDYYVRHAENENEHDILYFIIGDVSGKGMPAALMMTQVCSLFRNIVRLKHTPEEILAGINDVLAERNDLMMFCTAFIGAIDLENYEMHYANAGHDKPVIVPSATSGKTDYPHAQYLEIAPNVPIAIREGRKFKGDSIQLQKGYQVILYTDGVTESMNKRKVLFGEANLLKTVQKGGSLQEAVQRHANGADQSDDITILRISL